GPGELEAVTKVVLGGAGVQVDDPGETTERGEQPAWPSSGALSLAPGEPGVIAVNDVPAGECIGGRFARGDVGVCDSAHRHAIAGRPGEVAERDIEQVGRGPARRHSVQGVAADLPGPAAVDSDVAQGDAGRVVLDIQAVQ